MSLLRFRARPCISSTEHIVGIESMFMEEQRKEGGKNQYVLDFKNYILFFLGLTKLVYKLFIIWNEMDFLKASQLMESKNIFLFS